MQDPTRLGTIIDFIVRRQYHQHKEHENIGLTEFTQKVLTEKSGLSERQIARLRQETGFPKDDAVRKLIQAAPDLEVLNPETIAQRILLPFGNIEREQQQLAKTQSLKITIVAGWKKPQGLENNEIATSIVNNISNDSRYEFIFPALDNHPQKGREEAEKELKEWLKKLIITVGAIWKAQQRKEYMEKGEHLLLKQDSDIVKELSEKIQFISTQNKDVNSDSLNNQFWYLLPSRYVVLYNLGNSVDESLKFGVSLMKGLLQQQESRRKGEKIELIFPAINSQGWLYIEDEDYRFLEQEYNNKSPKWSLIKLGDIDLENIITLI